MCVTKFGFNFYIHEAGDYEILVVCHFAYLSVCLSDRQYCVNISEKYFTFKLHF